METETEDSLKKLQNFAIKMIDRVDAYKKIKRKKSLKDEDVKNLLKKDYKITDEEYINIKDYAGKSKVMMPLLNKLVGDNMIKIQPPDLTNISMPTKMLVKFLAEYKLPTTKSLQCVFDFETSEISDSIINGNDDELKQEFVDSIRKLDKTGEDDNDFAIDSTKTSLDSKTPEVTIPVNLTKPSPTVVFSKYLTDGAKTFEEYYKKEYKTNKDDLMVKSSNSAEIPAIPLYFVSACQARKKNKKIDKYYETWKKFEGIYLF